MPCNKFKSKKNNTWRNVKLDFEKENAISKFFGIDTETRVDELLQHNLTLFEWIRKNQGFPYFIGRRINGDSSLSNDEINYIKANGSKAIPILTPYPQMNGIENAKMATAILRNLQIEKNIPVFLAVDAENVTNDYLLDYAESIVNSGYIPGFYVDTDSFYDFDRQFSRAYQSNEELMKKCKLWALSPEMEEFFETKDAHSEKPTFWGPFAPSCINKEQIMIWQYGKKAHPVNTYSGKKANFNLNIAINIFNIFDICDVELSSYKFEKKEKCQFETCIINNDVVETVRVDCNFVMAKSQSLLENNKIYSKDVISEHKILEFVICLNNDVFSPKHLINEGEALIKFTFVSNESSCINRVRMIVSLNENNVLNKILQDVISTDVCEEIQSLAKQEMWIVSSFKEENSKEQGVDNKEQTNSNIKNYIYKENGDIFEYEIISPMATRSSISGDKYNIFSLISESLVKSSGIKSSTIKSANGYPALAYIVDSCYAGDNLYISKIAIWNLTPNILTTNAPNRIIEFMCQKSYNAFVYYYVDSDSIEVVYAPDDSTYVTTNNTQISVNLVGCHTAYIDKCTFEVSLGGGSTQSTNLTGTLLGILSKPLSNILNVYSVLKESAHIIQNYNYNNAKNQYELYPQNGLVTKQVGSTYTGVWYKKYSLLKTRCILENVSFCPTSRIYCQIQTKALSTFAGDKEFRFGGSIPLI